MQCAGDDRTAALRNSSSTIYRTLVKILKAEVAKAGKVGKDKPAPRVSLDSALPYAELEFLRHEFGYELNAQPQGQPLVAPFFSAYAKCVSRSLMEQKAWKGEEVLCVNGDVRQLVIRGDCGIKVVRFYDDVSNLMMFLEEDAFLRRSCRSNKEKMRNAASTLLLNEEAGCSSVYSRAGYDAPFTADTLFFDPTRARVGLGEVARLMIKFGACRSKGWLPFAPSVVRASDGVLCGGRLTFHVDVDNSRVVFFEKGGSFPCLEYRLVDYFSFLRREPLIVGDDAFSVEFQGASPDRLEWFVSRIPAAELVGLPTEKVPVWSDSAFGRPSVLVSFLVHMPGETGKTRVVLRDDEELFGKAVSALVTSKQEPTVKAAHAARSNYRDQVMLPSGGVVLPPTPDAVVEDLLARAVMRRAAYTRTAMAVERAAHEVGMRGMEDNLESLSRGVFAIMRGTGKMFLQALRAPAEVLRAAATDETWDVCVVQETPKIWVEKCWAPLVGSFGRDIFLNPAYLGKDGPSDHTWRSASAACSAEAIKGAVKGFFEDERSSATRNTPLGAEREAALAKLVEVTGAEERAPIDRTVVRATPREPPTLADAVIQEVEPDAMAEEFDEEFPGLSSIDVDVRPYIAAESERAVASSAPLIKLPVVDAPVPMTKQKVTGFAVGVSGPRPRCVGEVLSAYTQRVAGAPTYQWEMDMERALESEFKRFAAVFFKEGWEEVVDRRVRADYMYPSTSDMRKVTAKLTPSNVKRVLTEDFKTEGILPTILKAMTKREPKDRQDLSTALEHKPTQTIMYQESKVTNAYFSAALSNFHDCLDDVLRDGFFINPRKDKKDVETLWNSVQVVAGPGERVVKADADISQCDKSQTEANWMRYFYLLCVFGFGDFVTVWRHVVDLKRASDPSVSVLIQFINQVVSGLFNTISANSTICAWAVANTLPYEPHEIRRGGTSGDDAIFTMVTAKEVSAAAVSHELAVRFNFDTKLDFPEDTYWCGRYEVVVDGYGFFVKDPGRCRSSFFKPQGPKYDPEEAWEAFLDDTAAYEKEELVIGVAHAYARRRGLAKAPIRTVRAITALRHNKPAFMQRFIATRVLE